MKYLTDNKYLDALFKTMLLSALVHMVILIIDSLYKHDITLLNYFNILDLDFFVPEIAKGVPNFILGSVCLVLVYLSIYILSTKKR